MLAFKRFDYDANQLIKNFSGSFCYSGLLLPGAGFLSFAEPHRKSEAWLGLDELNVGKEVFLSACRANL